MIKAFWEGFRNGFTQASKYGILAAIAFVAGLTLGSYSHPYEVCQRMYQNDEDRAECVWLLQNE